MKLYLDVSCLNRPFDDQSQARIRLEAEAITLILERVDSGDWTQVSSELAVIETDAIPDADRRARVRLLLPKAKDILKLDDATWSRAAALQAIGFKVADAAHVAAAEMLQADVFLSCDDRLCRLAKRHRPRLSVRVANPIDWLTELADDSNP